jgi:hypothetical protein
MAFGLLTRFLRRTLNTPPRTAFFHEDDYGQIEVVPLSTLEHCLRQAGGIQEFSEQHRTEFGWTDVYVRTEPEITLRSLGLRLKDVRNCLTPILSEYDRVETGTFSDAQPCKQVAAFGNKDTNTIFVAYDPEGAVNAIWCSEPLKELTLLPQAEALLLADWGWSFFCPLSDLSRLEEYLSERHRLQGLPRLSSDRGPRAKLDVLSLQTVCAPWRRLAGEGCGQRNYKRSLMQRCGCGP